MADMKVFHGVTPATLEHGTTYDPPQCQQRNSDDIDSAVRGRARLQPRPGPRRPDLYTYTKKLDRSDFRGMVRLRRHDQFLPLERSGD
jgi:hypothetical protein